MRPVPNGRLLQLPAVADQDYRYSDRSMGTSLGAKQARQEARLREQPRYLGDVCLKDPGHGRERYVNNTRCVRCAALTSLNNWNVSGKGRALRRKLDSPKSQAIAKRYAYSDMGNRYARKRDPADAYPFQASDELRWEWRQGYARLTGRHDLPVEEARQLVRESRRIWLLVSFGEDQDNLDLV